ncbi:MAG: cytochrome c family protein [Myxococcota bacterium]
MTWSERAVLRTGLRPFGYVLVVFALLSSACGNPDSAILASMSEPEQARFLAGRQVAVKCWTCHDLAGTVKKVGPSLLGVYGRRSGMAPGYEGSDAMRAASIVWDDQSLGAFLSNPGAYVPGNRMVSPGIGDRGQLSNLLFYLRHVTRPGAREMQAN